MTEQLSNTMGQSERLAEIVGEARSGYRTVEEMVVAALREAVLSGVFKPGEKLPQEQLAQDLGVSRIPVRAALKQLESEGLAVFSPHRGATVRQLTPNDVAEIYDLRIMLESYALRGAFEKITPAEVDEFGKLADELDQRAEGQEWLDLRERFYDRLYEIAQYHRTADMIRRLRAEVGRYWLSLRVVEHDDGVHQVVIDAIRSGDADAAVSWLGEHLTRVSEELQRRITEATDQA